MAIGCGHLARVFRSCKLGYDKSAGQVGDARVNLGPLVSHVGRRSPPDVGQRHGARFIRGLPVGLGCGDRLVCSDRAHSARALGGRICVI